MNKISKFLNVNLIYIPKKKEVILFIIPIFVYILYIFNAIPSFYYGFDANIFMALYSATVGYKYVEPYISKVKNNVGDTLLTVILIMIAKGFLLRISFFLLNTNDPQGLSQHSNTFNHFIYKDFLYYIFVGIGEELLNFYILLTLISFINRKYRFIISVLITSIIFGMLHSINWPILAAFPIALSHMPYIYSYGRYKSLLPAMIAHAISDMLVALTLIPGMESIIANILQISVFIIMVTNWNRICRVME